MKLIDSLYSIISDSANESGHDYTIRLNPEHIIYKAHFPGEPITPGVCIMQIARELLEKSTGLPLEIDYVKNIKFLRIISPADILTVDCSLSKVSREDSHVKAQAVMSAGGEICAKLSISCRILDYERN
ncbi:MAG: 3-hydroxyacyl-ACP dehydratase FabZ family protein [Candidatus Cryptobacteroides sp.]